MSLIIGLTGGLATGKTTVADMFARLGAKVINADTIVHQLLAPGGSCLKAVRKAFGNDIFPNGQIDRRKLAGIVFKDRKKLRQLEKILHPEVKKIIKEEIKRYRKSKKKGIVILDVPLLFEVGLEKNVDYIVVVKASRDVQLKRAAQNLWLTKSEALRRIKAQLPLGVKSRLADIIINNQGSKKQVEKEVEKVWQRLQSRINNQ